MLRNLMSKYSEAISYLFFGVCTTLINFIVFFIVSNFIAPEITNIIAWIISVAFAYITNKIFVFKSKGFSIKEIFEFAGARIFSLLFEEACLIIMLNVFFVNTLLSKIIINVFVIIMNYVLSKFIIFKKKGDTPDGK